MPSCEFECLECEHRMQVYMSFEELGKREIYCPSCGSKMIPSHYCDNNEFIFEYYDEYEKEE